MTGSHSKNNVSPGSGDRYIRFLKDTCRLVQVGTAEFIAGDLGRAKTFNVAARRRR